MLNQMVPWMVTTNIAITKSQIARGRKGIPKWEIEYSEKYKPYFLIEFDLNVDTYIIHIDDEIENVFNEALLFRRSFCNLNKDIFIATLKRYYIFDEVTIIEEISKICEHYRFDNNNVNSFNDYEILEDENT